MGDGATPRRLLERNRSEWPQISSRPRLTKRGSARTSDGPTTTLSSRSGTARCRCGSSRTNSLYALERSGVRWGGPCGSSRSTTRDGESPGVAVRVPLERIRVVTASSPRHHRAWSGRVFVLVRTPPRGAARSVKRTPTVPTSDRAPLSHCVITGRSPCPVSGRVLPSGARRRVRPGLRGWPTAAANGMRRVPSAPSTAWPAPGAPALVLGGSHRRAGVRRVRGKAPEEVANSTKRLRDDVGASAALAL